MSERYEMYNVVSVLGNVASDIREQLSFDGSSSLPDRLEAVSKNIEFINEREQYFEYIIDCLKQEMNVIDDLLYGDNSSNNPSGARRQKK